MPENPDLIKVASNNQYSELNDPPLVDLKVTNPVSYLKKWLKKLLNNEGIDLRLKIKPLTAVLITLLLTGTGYSLKALGVLFPYLPDNTPVINTVPFTTPTPVISYQTTFYGVLRKASDNNFYLLTANSEVILLNLPNNLNLTKELGKRILATGKYNKQTNTLEVSQTSQLEVLPTIPQAIPTLPITPTPTSKQGPSAVTQQ